MTLSLPDHWVWDFWLAWDGDTYHAFYLKAPRALGDPDARHRRAVIGHATSPDLERWEVQEDALAPAESPGFDDLAVWTGCVVQADDAWWMFYTGVDRAGSGKIQRVGLARSLDLHHWTRVTTQPVCSIDGPWYERLESGTWHNQGWRDPWVFPDANSDQFHAFITARSADGPIDARGVVAHAVSPDLQNWRVLEPVATPGISGDLEVPQLFVSGGRCYLIFCTHRWSEEQRLEGREGPTTAYLVGSSPLGPFSWHPSQVLLPGHLGWFGGRIVDVGPRAPALMAWRRVTASGGFGGEISDPMPLRVTDEGQLEIGRVAPTSHRSIPAPPHQP